MVRSRRFFAASYDEGGKRTKFDAVMLTVYKARNGACQMVALTMQPLEEQ